MNTHLCPRCNKREEFGINRLKKDGMQTSCKKCRQRYQRDWYQKHKRLHKARAWKSNELVRVRNRKLRDSYLRSHPCIDCGEKDIEVLTFDHVRGVKRLDICSMIRRAFTWNTILKEIGLCEVRCANCHTKVTRKRREDIKLNGRAASS